MTNSNVNVMCLKSSNMHRNIFHASNPTILPYNSKHRGFTRLGASGFRHIYSLCIFPAPKGACPLAPCGSGQCKCSGGFPATGSACGANVSTMLCTAGCCAFAAGQAADCDLFIVVTHRASRRAYRQPLKGANRENLRKT